MICKNCPFGTERLDGYIQCDIDEEDHEPYDECFFPETIMEKGV